MYTVEGNKYCIVLFISCHNNAVPGGEVQTLTDAEGNYLAVWSATKSRSVIPQLAFFINLQRAVIGPSG